MILIAGGRVYLCMSVGSCEAGVVWVLGVELSPLGEQRMLLTTKPSLQLLQWAFKNILLLI